MGASCVVHWRGDVVKREPKAPLCHFAAPEAGRMGACMPWRTMPALPVIRRAGIVRHPSPARWRPTEMTDTSHHHMPAFLTPLSSSADFADMVGASRCSHAQLPKSPGSRRQLFLHRRDV